MSKHPFLSEIKELIKAHEQPTSPDTLYTQVQPQLPQEQPNDPERQQALKKAREEYQFDYSYHQLGFIKKVPKSENYSPQCKAVLHQTTVEFLKCWWQGACGNLKDDIEEATDAVAHELEAKGLEFFDRVFGEDESAKEFIVELMSRTAEAEGNDLLSRYEGMFHGSLKLPQTAQYWDSDSFFAYQMVAGAVPNAIALIESPMENFPVTEEHYRAVGDSKTLAEAMAEKRVFVVDLKVAQPLVSSSPVHSDLVGVDKYMLAPIAMFAWVEDSSQSESSQSDPSQSFSLKPVAIQCGQTNSERYPIFTPSHGYRWKMARMSFLGALGGISGYYEHFGTHMLIERCIISTYRTLAFNHPINILLRPNYQYTIAANRVAKLFTLPGFFLDTLMAPELDASMQMTAQYVKRFRFDEASPPEMFKRRGLDDEDVLPEYPFRHDTTAVWHALQEFVSAYVARYYPEDAVVANDKEVQAWIAELQAPQGGRLSGIGEIKTAAALAELVAKIMYHASAFHSALNYSGYSAFGFPLVMTYASLAAPPTRDTPDTEEEFLKYLPSMRYAWIQLWFVWIQYSLWENELGVYNPNYANQSAPPQYKSEYFYNREDNELADKFTERLYQIYEQIQELNKHRFLPYVIQQPGYNITASLQC